jgi:hypothetical protein
MGGISPGHRLRARFLWDAREIEANSLMLLLIIAIVLGLAVFSALRSVAAPLALLFLGASVWSISA